jgi:hypothetical protein
MQNMRYLCCGWPQSPAVGYPNPGSKAAGVPEQDAKHAEAQPMDFKRMAHRSSPARSLRADGWSPFAG